MSGFVTNASTDLRSKWCTSNERRWSRMNDRLPVTYSFAFRSRTEYARASSLGAYAINEAVVQAITKLNNATGINQYRFA